MSSEKNEMHTRLFQKSMLKKYQILSIISLGLALNALENQIIDYYQKAELDVSHQIIKYTFYVV